MNTQTDNAALAHQAPPQAWLALRREDPLEPDLPIVDAHHHLWDRTGHRYLLDEFLTDIRQSGHDIRASVYVQARAMYRAAGEQALRPVGETEFANGVAAMSASGAYGPARLCAAIVGFADLTMGDRVEPVLEAHVRAGGGRFRGIRQIATWDGDARVMNPTLPTRPQLLDDPEFRRGAACLARLGLSFDAWVFHPQLPDVMRLADALPGLTIVLNHLGGPLNIHAYAGRRAEIMGIWERHLRELARRPNVVVKLGGVGMRISGFGYPDQPRPPSSQTLCEDWWPYVQRCIDAFGPGRCMFESNFPVDKAAMDYGVFWNACKRMTTGFSADERARLFSGTARQVYLIDGD